MKRIGIAAVLLLALAGTACGSSGSDDSSSSEDWCVIARSIEGRVDGLGPVLGSGSADEIEHAFTHLLEDFDAAVDAVPDEIKDEVKQSRSSMVAFDAALKAGGYDLLDVDQDEIASIVEAGDKADDAISAYNEKECGIAADSTDTTMAAVPMDDYDSDDYDYGTDATMAAGSTGREQIAAQLVESGFTPEEAKCISEAVDPEMAMSSEANMAMTSDLFDGCGIGIARLAETGASATGG